MKPDKVRISLQHAYAYVLFGSLREVFCGFGSTTTASAAGPRRRKQTWTPDVTKEQVFMSHLSFIGTLNVTLTLANKLLYKAYWAA